MDNKSSESAHWKHSVGNFALLLLAVFASELAIMELLSPICSQLGRVPTALTDASGLALFSAFPISHFLTRLSPAQFEAGKPEITNRSLLVKAASGIFLIEFLVMLEIPTLFVNMSSQICDLLDAALTSLLCAVPLWRLLFTPEMRKRSCSLIDTPLRLYVLVLCMVFLSDLVQETLLLFLGTQKLFVPDKIVDAFLTTVVCAPLVWLFVARPLKRAAVSEEARVAAVYTQVIDGLVVINSHGVVSSFNPAAEQIFGYPADEMIGRSAALLFEGGHRVLVELMRKAPDRAKDQRFIEFNCRRRDGLGLIMTVSTSEIFLEGKSEFLLLMRDVTSRKQMEEKLRESETRFKQVFHQSEDGILFLEPGGDILLDANEKAESIFGYSKAQLKAGGFGQICASAAPPGLAQAVVAVTEEAPVHQDFVCRRQDQTEIVVSLRARRMVLQGGAVTYCSFRDVTERVRQAEKTREIQGRLIQTNKMTSLGLLVSGVAHEINNPNNFISANCEILARISEDMLKALQEYGPEGDQGVYLGGIPLRELGDQTRRLIEGIGTGSRRVTDIVTNLKGFARQERTQQKHEVDVNQVARSAVSLMDHELIKFTDNFHLELAEHTRGVGYLT